MVFAGFEDLSKAMRKKEHKDTVVTIRGGSEMVRPLIKVVCTVYEMDDYGNRNTGVIAVYFVDCVTGTLYNTKTGRCMSSDQMWIEQ